MSKEIERKWFFKEDTKDLINWKELKSLPVCQDVVNLSTYINLIPELRLRHVTDLFPADNSSPHFFFAYKVGKGLTRTEVEFPISKSTYEDFIQTVSPPSPIYIRNTKYVWIGPHAECYDTEDPEIIHRLPTKFIIEHRVVDPGLSTGFEFIEVEFESEEQASHFVFPLPSFRENLDEYSSASMADYWTKTRLTHEV